MRVVELPRVRGIEKTSDAFLQEVVRLSARQNLDPGWLLAVMARETAGTFDPAIRNPKGSATGLIQFTRQTARSLGTTVEALAAMSQVEQLVYVERFFAPHAKRNLNRMRPVDTYLAVFAPAHIGKPLSSVVYASPSKEYTANAGLDYDKTNAIEVSDVAFAIEGELRRAARLDPVLVLVDGVSDAVAAGALVVALAGVVVVLWDR